MDDDERGPRTVDDEPLVQRAIELEASLDEVWAALTEPERLSAWVGGAVLELEIRPGGRGTVRREDGAVRRVVVEAVAPERRLALRWWPFDDGAGPSPVGSGTRVEFRLEPVADGVLLHVVERGPLVLGSLAPRADAESWTWPARDSERRHLAGLDLPELRACVR